MTAHQAAALADVRSTFANYTVDHVEMSDGSLWVVIRDVRIGDGWNHTVIDLAVKLLLTYPTPPPYPFYGPAGLARTDGRSFSPTQSNRVQVDGAERCQISLRIGTQQSFDLTHETLAGRFMAVIEWLRNPR